MTASEQAERRRTIGYGMFCAGDSIEHIAEHLGVSHGTVSGWVRKYGWRTGKSVVEGDMDLPTARAADQRIDENPAIQNQTLALKASFEVFRDRMAETLVASAEELAEEAKVDAKATIGQSRNILQLTQAAERIFPEMKPQAASVNIAVGDPSKLQVRAVDIPSLEELTGG